MEWDWNRILVIGGWVVTTLIALIGAWPVLRRTKAQNTKDTVDALKVAMELVGMDAEEQLNLKNEVRDVKEKMKIMDGRKYKITVIFTLGEKPAVEEASIETYDRGVGMSMPNSQSMV